jgi:hypothetical protein
MEETLNKMKAEEAKVSAESGWVLNVDIKVK